MFRTRICHFTPLLNSFFLEIDIQGPREVDESKKNSAIVIILAVLSSLLCLSVLACVVYYRRRVSGKTSQPLTL